MAVAVAPYSQEHFKSLPSLNEALTNFHEKDGNKLVDEIFKDLFVKNGMDRVFGLSMPHRHFDVEAGMKLVSYNGVSAPWFEKAAVGMDEPLPVSWSFSAKGDLHPTEFKYAKGEAFEMGKKELAFIATFKTVLDSLDLGQLFGLCLYPGDDFMGSCEVTRGDVNVNLEPKDFPDGVVGADTAWFFSPPLIKRGCRCTCDNRQNPHGHGAHVITVNE